VKPLSSGRPYICCRLPTYSDGPTYTLRYLVVSRRITRIAPLGLLADLIGLKNRFQLGPQPSVDQPQRELDMPRTT
jgi:hypothetical protein